MIVDGRKIASDIYKYISEAISNGQGDTPHLTVFTCSPNFETQKYLELKKRKAAEVGIRVNVVEFPKDVTTEEVVQSLLNDIKDTDGVIVQLPFPSHIDTDKVLGNIPANKDIDLVHYEGNDRDGALPPVVGAIQEMVNAHKVDLSGEKVAVVGAGRLVGKPAALWAAGQGANVTVLTKETPDIDTHLKEADIIITGAGDPGFITADKIKEGVIIFDAGTSEEGGVLRGDVDPTCAEKASLFTPVPGGIGPVTVAVLLRNLLLLSK